MDTYHSSLLLLVSLQNFGWSDPRRFKTQVLLMRSLMASQGEPGAKPRIPRKVGLRRFLPVDSGCFRLFQVKRMSRACQPCNCFNRGYLYTVTDRHTNIQTNKHAFIHPFVRPSIQPARHAYIHTYIHT